MLLLLSLFFFLFFRGTHVSGAIFIWPSTIRLNELERIIHSSIICLPPCSPLRSDLLASPALPQHQRFIPVVAAVCIRPIVAHWLQDKKKQKKQDEIGTSREREGERLEVLRSQCKHRKRQVVKGAMQIFVVSYNLWSFGRSLNMPGSYMLAHMLTVWHSPCLPACYDRKF